jgi:hypothetical protein
MNFDLKSNNYYKSFMYISKTLIRLTRLTLISNKTFNLSIISDHPSCVPP